MVAPRFRVPDGFFEELGDLPRAASAVTRELSIDDEEYPELLRNTPRAPKKFFVSGMDLRELEPRVCVIGARNATEYGLHAAYSISRELALHGATIVSGLARGADSAAHDGALAARGKTIGAVATGVDVCYPRSSSVLFAEILATQGAIVSVNPPGMSCVRKGEFITRNELMIGMCEVVLVIQGGAKSAAVGTGIKALHNGRSVFAVPGPIDSFTCAGTNALLKLPGAQVCTSADDVLKAVIDEYKIKDPAKHPIPTDLPDPERAILFVLRDGAASRETVVMRSDLDVTNASRAIASLEIDGFVAVVNDVVRRLR
ncbi:MAG: DNA-processing protein DprA [Actinomycetota bacterium]